MTDSCDTAAKVQALAALVERLKTDLERLEGMVSPAAKTALSARRVESIKRAQDARRLYSDAEKAAWRVLALSPDLSAHSKSRKAELIAQRRGLCPPAASTIRRCL